MVGIAKETARPDFIVALHGDPKLLFARKEEYDVPELISMQHKMDTALTFLENRGVRVLRIDTTMHDVDECSRLVQEKLWDHIGD